VLDKGFPVQFVTHLCWFKAVDLYFSFLSSSACISLLILSVSQVPLCSPVSIFPLHHLSPFYMVVDFGLNGLGLKSQLPDKNE
jgi:hypothetical protein